ncbi:MAG: pilus assembly protein, partial [Alphaproteobacteria bacterium]
MPGLRLSPGRAIRAGALPVAAAILAAWTLLVVRPVHALDIDIFTAGQVKPNVLIVFDNSGSMSSQAYNTYPNTLYTGNYAAGTIYTRCKTVTTSCTCGTTTTAWNVDNSTCATSFTDLQPPPSGDDTDDRESRRKRGNRLNFETSPPKNCTLSPFQPCTTATQCTGTGNTCAAQSKMAVAKAVMSAVVNDPANDVRFGLEIFNPPGIDYALANYASSSWVTAWQVNSGVYQFAVQDMTTASRSSLSSVINGLSAGGATPTAHRLVDAWKYFNGQATAAGFSTSPVQQTCQRNYMLMVTDGIPEVEADYNASPQSACRFTRLQSFVGNPGDLNGDGKENPASPNWIATTGEAFNCGSDYLDDAMVKVRGLQPLSNALNQPLALYAVSFGFDYCQAPASGDTSPGSGSLLWRAAERYGGGKCLSATQPEELDAALRAAINMIKADAQSFVAPIVPVSPSTRTQSGDRIYLTLFTPRDGGMAWAGNIKKYGLDYANGTICNASSASSCTTTSGAATDSEGTLLKTAESFWDGASTPSGKSVTDGGVGGVLAARSTPRAIYTYAGASTGNLGALALTATAQDFAKTNAAITPAMLGLTGTDATTANRDLLIDYVTGYDSYDEDRDGNLAEKRSWVLGDIIHSAPLVVSYGTNDALILAGSNDGMLHAFDDATGQEVWAFVPPDLLPKLTLLRPGQSGSHPFLVDGAAKLRTLSDGRKVIVFGLGRGGRAYYGLDVTVKAAPKLLWRVNSTTTGFGELGYSTSTPMLARFANGGSPVDVAVFG